MGSRAKLPAQPRVLNQAPRQVSTLSGSAPWTQFSSGRMVYGLTEKAP
jgi:hypothetical protein